jgi:hypothetical protein
MAFRDPPDSQDNIIDLEKFRVRWKSTPDFNRFVRGDFFRKVLLPLLAVVIGLKLFFSVKIES